MKKTGSVDIFRGAWRVRLSMPDGTRRTFIAPADIETREQAEVYARVEADGSRHGVP